MEKETPYISVVVAARNDNHGGNMLRRMQAFIDSWIGQARRYQLPSEIVVVEWNPPAGRPRLIEDLHWPASPHPVDVRFIEVPPEVHQSIGHAQTIPLQQMIAKNAGIRRARGSFVVATNLDIVFSAELMRFFASRRLEAGSMYRIDRTDVAGDVPAGGTVDELLRYCEEHVIHICAREGGFAVRPNGFRELAPQDVADPDSGIDIGGGWYPVEPEGGEHPRWVESGAEIAFLRPPGAAPQILIDAEAGPSAGGATLPVDVLDSTGRVLASATVAGRSQLRLHLPPGMRAGRIQLRLQSRELPLALGLRKRNLRIYRMEWEKAPGMTRTAHDTVIRQAADTPGAVPDTAGYTPAGQVNRRPSPSGGNTDAQDPHPDWRLEVVHSHPGRAGEGLWETRHPLAAQMRRSAYLHTNACGDFTMLARDDWFALRGYPEWPIWPTHIDSVFCYSAYHAGMREVILGAPMRVFHIAHQAVWTPAGESERNGRARRLGVASIQYADFVRWVEMMRRLDAPMIFTTRDWGLAGKELPETRVAPVSPGA
jgi:hypothetical protein